MEWIDTDPIINILHATYEKENIDFKSLFIATLELEDKLTRQFDGFYTKPSHSDMIKNVVKRIEDTKKEIENHKIHIKMKYPDKENEEVPERPNVDIFKTIG